MGASRANAVRCALLPLALVWWMCPGMAEGQGAEALAAPEAGGGPVATQASADPTYEAEWLAVVPASLLGVDDAIAAPLEQRLAESGRSLGYRLRPEGAVSAAVKRVGPGRIASPADLWRVTYASGSHASLHVRVWAQEGRYVLELTVALLDGRGPFVVRRATDHLAFLQTADAMVREALPAAGTGAAAPAARVAPRRPPPGVSADAFEPSAAPEDERPEPPLRRIGLAATTEGAFGLGERRFYNHLAGARLDVRLTHEVVLGVYAGYANLAGYQGRVGNFVSYLQVESRVRVSDRNKLRIPLRFAAGYVPHNGPLLRMAAGLAFPSSDRFEWGIDLLAPTIWFLPEGKVATSLNLGFEMIFNP